jgi:hypothetical protein
MVFAFSLLLLYSNVAIMGAEISTTVSRRLQKQTLDEILHDKKVSSSQLWNCSQLTCAPASPETSWCNTITVARIQKGSSNCQDHYKENQPSNKINRHFKVATFRNSKVATFSESHRWRCASPGSCSARIPTVAKQLDYISWDIDYEPRS